MAKKKFFVSIIIPSYNAAAYVKTAVESALKQTYRNREVIVVDDGSTDNTKEVLAPYIARKRIKYIKQENQGLAAARNTGIKESKGDLIALLDADDIFLPQKLERQAAYLEANPRCDICYSNLYHFWDGKEGRLFSLDYEYYSGDEVLPNLVKKNFIAPLAMVIRRDVFERYGAFDPNFRRSEDLEFLVRAASRGARVCFLNERLAKLRLRRDSNLQSFASQPEVKRTALKIFENLYLVSTREERERLGLKKYLVRYRLKTGLAYLENEDKENAKTFFVSAFRGYPSGRTFGSVLWFLISLIPGRLFANMIRWFHIKKQRSLLTADH